MQCDVHMAAVRGGPDTEREEQVSVPSDGEDDVAGLDGGAQPQADRERG